MPLIETDPGSAGSPAGPPAPSAGESPDPEAGIAFAAHDHAACRRAALDRLREAARGRGLRLTPARIRVLELLTESHRAMGAYELLDRLAAEGLGRQPPAIYRALDFLIDAGAVHRIERLNAYVACARPGAAHGARPPCFLICRDCRQVEELSDPALVRAVGRAAGQCGFAAAEAVVEIDGTCPGCAGTRA